MFNNYFINVADKLAEKIPKSNTKFQDYLNNPNEHSIYLKETTPAEVDKLISGLESNKAPDLYGMSSKIVKMGGFIFSTCQLSMVDSQTFFKMLKWFPATKMNLDWKCQIIDLFPCYQL